ncbi:MAG: cobalamin biosynthesis protein [Pseudomonadota bacterium]
MIAAGFGFRAEARLESLLSALNAAEGPAPQVIATLPAKADHPAMQALARQTGLPLRTVTPDGQTTPTQSTASDAAHGTGSVAEATALAAAGPAAHLCAPRAVSADRMATCAIATGGPE